MKLFYLKSLHRNPMISEKLISVVVKALRMLISLEFCNLPLLLLRMFWNYLMQTLQGKVCAILCIFSHFCTFLKSLFSF